MKNSSWNIRASRVLTRLHSEPWHVLRQGNLRTSVRTWLLDASPHFGTESKFGPDTYSALDKSISCPLVVPGFFFVQTKTSWRTLLTIWYSTQPPGIKVQSFPVLR